MSEHLTPAAFSHDCQAVLPDEIASTLRRGLCETSTIVAELGRVRLRTWVLSDIDWYADLVADEKVMRFIADGSPRPRDRALQEIDRFRAEQDERGWSRWVCERAEDSEPVGFIGFSVRNGVIDWGGRSFSHHWGSGLTVLAQIAALEAGLLAHGIEEAVAVTDLDNKHVWRGNLRFGWSDPVPVERYGRPHVMQTINRASFVERAQASRNRAISARLALRGRGRVAG